MSLKKYRPLFEIIALSIPGYLLHKLFFYWKSTDVKFQNFYTPLELVYGFFLLASLNILFILLQVKERNFESMGYSFMFLTCLKMGVSYFFLQPILHSGNANVGIEKINFFIIFAYFLTIETVVTIRILNNKQ